MTRKLILISMLLASGVTAADEMYRLISDARYARAAADGTVFVLTGKREPTPGAWIQDCKDLPDSLTRIDGRTGAVLWSTCLPVQPESLAVDERGSVTIAAGTLGGVRATPGAYTSTGVDAIAVIRLNPAGTGPDWIATVNGNPAYPYGAPRAWAAVGPDGSVYVAASVTEENLPVTDGALRNNRRAYSSAYFFRLSADGSKLLHATYLNDGGESYASGLAVDGEGNVFVGGSGSAMATPGTFTTAGRWSTPAWVARFDPSSSTFRYVCVFGQLVELKIALASAGRGRVAVAGLGARGVLAPTAGAFFADQGAQAGDRESFVLLLNPEGTAADVVASYGLGSVRALESDANGNLIVAGEALSGFPGYSRSVVTTTANSWRIVGGADDDTGFVLKLSADGSRVLYATGIGCRSCAMQSVTLAGNTLWIAEADGSKNVTVAAAQPVTVQREEMSVLRAVPDNWPEVAPFNSATLSWDTRDPAVQSAEIRLGAPDGPVVARGTTGAIALNAETATYYFVDTTSGRRVLGVETFTSYTPLSGIPAYNGYNLTLNPNPVLSCRPSLGHKRRSTGICTSAVRSLLKCEWERPTVRWSRWDMGRSSKRLGIGFETVSHSFLPRVTGFTAWCVRMCCLTGRACRMHHPSR